MSRRADYNSLTAGDQTLQDEEAISATGEGDEEMEDAAEQEEEGYSACNAPRPATLYSNLLVSPGIHYLTCHCTCLDLPPSSFFRLLHPDFDTHMD